MGIGLGAAIAGGVLSAGAAAGSGICASNSAKSTAKSNAAQAASDRAMQYQLFRESRGEGGHAILPLYMGGFEQNASDRAQGIYNELTDQAGTPGEEVARYRAIINGMDPAISAGNQLVIDAQTGALTKQRLEDLAPVAQAREGTAEAKGQGIYQSMLARLNKLKAERGRAGFSGGSSFQNNRLLQATTDGRQGVATELAMARLQNAMDRNRIQDEGRDLAFRTLDTPATRARSLVGLQSLPAEAVNQAFRNRLAGADYFRLGVSQPPQLPGSYMMPNITPAGQVIGQAASSAISGVTNAYVQQQQAKQYQDMIANLYRQQQIGTGVQSSPVITNPYPDAVA